MANTFKLKRSAVQNKVPTTGDLQLGELALNTFDGKLYTKKDNGTASIVEIGAGGGVSDGDKGDITVSNSGTTWTVDNDAVTYAKIQNVSATDKLLGRSTAGAGDIEEITCTAAGRALLDDANAAAQRTTLGLGTLATQSGTFSGTSSGTNTGDQTISLTGDVTGSGTGSFAATLANSGVSAGTYNNSATAVTPITVDAKGRVTGTGSAITITPAFSSITSKPTTLSGYGITDALLANNGTASSLTLGSRTNSTSFGGNTTGLSGYSFTSEVRANSAKPALTWHYENVATRHIALESSGALNVLNPGEGGGAVFQVGGNTVLHAGNYTSYSPSLTGTGASGTWGISITGSSSTATTATNLSGGSVSATTGAFSTNLTAGTGAAVDPSNVTGFAAGQITESTTGFSAPGIAFGGSAGQHAAIVYAGNTLYFGTEDGSNNTMSTKATLTSGGVFNATNLTANSNQVLHAGNYTSYSPTLTGSGASGSWGINVTGSSASTTYLNALGVVGNLNTQLTTGCYGWDPNTTGKPADNYGQVIGIINAGNTQNNASNWLTQLGFGTSENTAYFRTKVNSNGWGSWYTFIHSGNYTSYSPSLTGTGASGTWGINVTGNAATATASTSAGNITGGNLTGDYQVTSGIGVRFGHANQTDSNDGFISAGRFGSGLNIVGTQTTGGAGRQVRIWGSLIDDGGTAYVRNSGSWGISVTGSSASCTGNAATATTASNLSGFTNSNSGNPIVGADALTNNGVGYVNSISLLGQTDGALHGQAYNSSWVHQIFGDYRTGQIAVRGRNNGTWQAWRNVLDSSNYVNYSPSLTGFNAFGTWGISISGNAATATTASAVAFSNVTSKPTTLSGYGITDGASNAANGCIQLNNQTISSSYTFTAGQNGVSAGPITISAGVTVTVTSGCGWSIV